MIVKPVIAILDDEPQMRKALQRLLMANDFQVRTYERADDLITDLPLQVLDCLVLDLHMPDINGLDVLENPDFQRCGPPVVVITGHDEPGVGQHVLALGASAYLKKPVDEAALLNAIQTAINAGPMVPKNVALS